MVVFLKSKNLKSKASGILLKNLYNKLVKPRFFMKT
jgi:hypothetical protein